jgi:hypothetical protein
MADSQHALSCRKVDFPMISSSVTDCHWQRLCPLEINTLRFFAVTTVGSARQQLSYRALQPNSTKFYSMAKFRHCLCLTNILAADYIPSVKHWYSTVRIQFFQLQIQDSGFRTRSQKFQTCKLYHHFTLQDGQQLKLHKWGTWRQLQVLGSAIHGAAPKWVWFLWQRDVWSLRAIVRRWTINRNRWVWESDVRVGMSKRWHSRICCIIHRRERRPRLVMTSNCNVSWILAQRVLDTERASRSRLEICIIIRGK